MGDKGGKKDKDKVDKQKADKQAKELKEKKAKEVKSVQKQRAGLQRGKAQQCLSRRFRLETYYVESGLDPYQFYESRPMCCYATSALSEFLTYDPEEK